MALLLLASSAAGQSSFESDPFASRFRERPNLDIKFRAPEAGGVITVSVSDGKGGRQSLLSENVYEVQAPKGGVVTLEYQDIKLTADYVRADRRTKIVVAEGDVVLEQGPSRLKGLRLELDLTDKTGVVTDGSAELAGIFVRGATLAKTGTRTFEIRDGALTACDGERPAWEFKLKDGVVTLDDYARLKKVVFELGGVPLLYTPYLLWPALRDRASGFMIPAVGYSSGRGGWLGLSYFQVLGRSADATVTTDLYTKKFFGLGTELRLRPSEGTTFSGTYYTVIDPNERWQWKTSGSLVADDLAPRTRAVVNWLQFSDLAFFQSYDRDFSLTSTRTVGQRAFVTHSEGPVALNLRLERDGALRRDRGRPGEETGPGGAPPADRALRQRGLRRGPDLGRLPPLDPPRGPALGVLRAIRRLSESLRPALAPAVALAQRRGGLPPHRLRGVGRGRRPLSLGRLLHARHGGGRPRADGPFLRARL